MSNIPPPPPLPGAHTMEANGRYPAKPVSPSFLVIMNAINAMTHFMLGAVVISAFSYAAIVRPYVRGLYSQHIYLCVTGYVILMSQAILAFNPHAGWSAGLLRPQQTWVHLTFQIGGSILAITGSAIKMADEDANFVSGHGILGFIAMLLTSLSLVGGVVNVYCNAKLRSRNHLYEGRNIFTIAHACLVVLTVTIAFIALIAAYHEYYRDSVFGDTNANLAIVCAVFGLFGLVVSALTKSS